MENTGIDAKTMAIYFYENFGFCSFSFNMYIRKNEDGTKEKFPQYENKKAFQNKITNKRLGQFTETKSNIKPLFVQCYENPNIYLKNIDQLIDNNHSHLYVRVKTPKSICSIIDVEDDRKELFKEKYPELTENRRYLVSSRGGIHILVERKDTDKKIVDCDNYKNGGDLHFDFITDNIFTPIKQNLTRYTALEIYNIDKYPELRQKREFEEKPKEEKQKEEIKPNQLPQNLNEDDENTEQINEYNSNHNENKDPIFIKRCLMEILNKPKYYDIYDNWIEVGFYLGSLQKTEIYKPIFKEWSMLSTKYKPNDENQINKYDPNRKIRKNINQLYNLFRKENFPLYIKIKLEVFGEEEILMKDIDIMKKTNIDLAKIIKELSDDIFIYDEKEKTFYLRIDNGYLQEITAESKLLFDIVDGLRERYIFYYKKYLPEKSKEPLLKELKNLIGQWNNDQIFNYMKKIFNDPFISKKLNKLPPNLLPFKNGILDLLSGEFCESVNGYYLTNYIDRDYFISSNDEIERVKKVVLDIFDHPVHKYIPKWLLYCISGYSQKQQFYWLKGKGSNGKSLLFSILLNVLGYLCYSANNQMIQCTDNTTDSKNIPLYNARNTNMILISELQNNKAINATIVKKISGGDVIDLRKNFSNVNEGCQFRSKLIICSNVFETFTENGHAMKRRLRILNMPFNFTDNPTKTNDKQRDCNLETEIKTPEFLNAFINWLIIEKQKENYKHIYSFEDPPEIIQYSEKYHKDNDYINAFINEYLQQIPYNCNKDKNNNDIYIDDNGEKINFLPCKEAFNLFKQTCYYQNNKLSLTKFCEELENIGNLEIIPASKHITKSIKGYKEKMGNENKEEDE